MPDKKHGLLVAVSVIAAALLFAGVFLPAGSVLGIETSYFKVSGYEKFIMLAAGVLVAVMALTKKPGLIAIFVAIVFISPIIPSIPSWFEKETVADKVVGAATDPLVDMGINLFFKLGSYGVGAFCMLGSLVAFIVAMFLSFGKSE